MSKADALKQKAANISDDELEMIVSENQMQDDNDAQEPSWFSTAYPAASGEDMADRYRSSPHLTNSAAPVQAAPPEAYEAYRRRIEERFKLAQRVADPAYAPQPSPAVARTGHVPMPPRPNLSRRQVDGQRMAHDQGPASYQEKVGAKVSVARSRAPQMIAFTVLAGLVGGAGGYAVANQGQVTGLARNAYAQLATWLTIAPETKKVLAETQISKKPVRIAKLEVNDISGPINGPIALDISAIAADSANPIALRISGLPPEAYLTKGMEVAKGEWLLKPADIAQAELIVPHSTVSELGLEVAALEEKSGEPAAPVKEMRVALDLQAVPVPGLQPRAVTVEPAAAVPDQGFNTKQALPAAIPAPLESVDPEALSLISKGESLLKSGDLIAARQFFLRAYELKVPEAAFGVGRTYDPAVYAELNVQGLPPDGALASEWYGKAAAKGYAPAAEALGRLSTVQP